MVGAFFMPGEICAFFMPIFTEGAEQANTALANGDISQEQYIWFTSKEYNFEDNSEPEYLKFLFSCLTKERIPYSSEAEWRLFSDFSELEEGENGKKFDFLVKPRAIVLRSNAVRLNFLLCLFVQQSFWCTKFNNRELLRQITCQKVP